MHPRTVYQELNSLITARQNCEKSGNAEWEAKHSERAEDIVADGPSGSGIDSGTKLDWERSIPGKRIVLTFGYHFMAESGMYDGWGAYVAVVTPSFDGIDIDIKGRNRNDIKPYLHDVFHEWLTSMEVAAEIPAPHP